MIAGKGEKSKEMLIGAEGGTASKLASLHQKGIENVLAKAR